MEAKDLVELDEEAGVDHVVDRREPVGGAGTLTQDGHRVKHAVFLENCRIFTHLFCNSLKKYRIKIILDWNV